MSLREKIALIVDYQDTFAGRLFDRFIIGLIIFSMLTLSLETWPDLPEQYRAYLRISEVVVSLLFTAEYLVRCWIAKPLRSYVFSWYGMIDLIAILPFFLAIFLGASGVDLRGVRAFRLLRMLRLLKFVRFGRTMARFKRAYEIARSELMIYLSFTAILLYVAATGIYYFEHSAQPAAFSSVFSSLWWAVVTLTTVGYGDVYPITVGGRIFTFFILMSGLGIVAVPAGLVASALSQAREEEEKEAQRLKRHSRDVD